MDLNYFFTSHHLIFDSFIALFPVINPIGSALLVSPYFKHLDRTQRTVASGKVFIYSFLFCLTAIVIGKSILNLFGLSLPVVQICGGIIIGKMGWNFLFDPETPRIKEEESIKENETKDIHGKLFYPITFPITIEAGAMSVLFTLSAHTSNTEVSDYIVEILIIMIAVLMNLIIVFFLYIHTNSVIKFVGTTGETIINKLIAFLILGVGIQISITGLLTLITNNAPGLFKQGI